MFRLDRQLKSRLDDDRYLPRFTPRKPTSSWTPQNVERAERFIEQGINSPHGKKVFARAVQQKA